MGYLFEFLFELVFEITAELVLAIYIKLMTWAVPEHKFDERLREKIKKGVTVFAALLFLSSLIGFFLFLQPPSITKTVGAYMLFIPLGIMGVQIILGIVCQIVNTIKKKKD